MKSLLARLLRIRRKYWSFLGWFEYYHKSYGWHESSRRAWRWARDAK